MEFHEYANLFPMMQPDELEDLVADVKRNGLIEPIVLYEDKILDGRNRFLACGEAGVKPHYEYYKGDEPVSYVISKNLHRRHLNKSQWAGVAWKAKIMLAEEAKKRQAWTPTNTKVELIPPSEQGKARDKAGEIFGVSGRYVDAFGKIEQEAPEYIEPIMQGEITITKAKREIAKEKIKNLPNPKLPEGKYSVIYADPPWPVGSIVMDKWESPIEDKYPTMSIEEIKALPVGDLAYDKCSLFMWTTHTFLLNALEIINEWGFKYSCCITWDKGGGWTQFGFHKRTEFLLYAYKGGINVDQYGDAIPTLISEKKTVHSKKPDSIREMIKLKTPEPRLEMFARGEYDGWVVWGNEVNNE